MTALTKIEGIGETYAEALKNCGVTSVESLLEQGATAAGRTKLANDVNVEPRYILNWVNRADLARVKGIGEEWADLLEATGVDTVPELAQRNAENLFKALEECNAEKNLCHRTPTLENVQDWVAQAKDLPRVITH